MRRKVTFGFALAAIVALSALAAFADDVVFTANAPLGPQFAKKMVVRSDLVGSTSPAKSTSTPSPTKPIPIIESSSTKGSSVLGQKTPGSTTVMATASPQMLLENRLKSLALELR